MIFLRKFIIPSSPLAVERVPTQDKEIGSSETARPSGSALIGFLEIVQAHASSKSCQRKW